MKKVFIVMPAYNVATHIEAVLKRIPTKIWRRISGLAVINDGSLDETLKVIKEVARKYSKIHIISKKVNEGYAKTQKTGFDYALKRGADIIILLHGDGQYAPEELTKLLKPLENNKADIVQGSRILGKGALRGGMPFWKFVLNIISSKIENLVFNMNIAEFHSGYMLYARKTLEEIPYRKLSDTFHFDGEMLFMAHKKNLRIKEVPIRTKYAGETSNLKPLQYGLDVLKIMWNYKRGKYNF